MKQLFVLVLVIVLAFPASDCYGQSWPRVPVADLSTLKPSDFTDDELDLPYYLKHFHSLANAVVETGAARGFINIPVWRSVDHNKPYNARIMENILSLAFFYCTERRWNMYYGHPAVKLRLEAALEFWCNNQHTDGRFSEYGDRLWNLPATAFATKFMGEALRLLKRGPAIDSKLLQRTIEADRKAIMIVLTSDSLYNAGKNYSNQFTNVYAGALAYMSIFQDPEMYARLKSCLIRSGKDFQSPTGFFYEAGGVDFGYNFNTHHSNLWMAYHYARGTELEKYFVDEERRYYDWIKFNAVPDSGYFTINRAIEMRQKTPVIHTYFLISPLSETVHGVRAFVESKEEKQQRIIRARKELEKNWPQVPELKPGDFSAFSPYAFLHREHYSWKPDKNQKQNAYQQLPYVMKSSFIHQRVDNRNPFVFSYIRRPGYYAAFNAGPVLRPQQRMGLGLIWHEAAGSFFQSQTDSDSAAWGTRAPDNKVYEARGVDATFTIENVPVNPVIGNTDLKDGVLSIKYALANSGHKSITFHKDRIEVAVEHAGIFGEYIPLLLRPGETIKLREAGTVMLTKKGIPIKVVYDTTAKASIVETSILSGHQRVVVVVIQSKGQLRYSIQTSLN